LLADGTTALMKAASAGHVDLVRVVIEAGADVNRRSGTGATALVEAAYAGQAEVARLLIAEGADVNASLDDGSTVLMAAAPGDHADIVRMLLAAGADVHGGPADGSTALMEAAYGGSAEVVRTLLAAGADVNAALDSGLTALMAAALGGYAEVAGDLLDAGADSAAEDSEGRTALTHGTASGSAATVERLLASGGARDSTEAALRIGTTYANEYYVSSDPNDIERARREFLRALEHDPNHPGALEWMGALEVLQWGSDPDLEQFRRTHAFLKRSVELDPDDADRHYWVASINWMFLSEGTGASAAERRSILEEGIEHAVKAIALDPWFDDAVAYLELLYRLKAEAVDTPAERNRLLDLAGATSREAVRIREERGGRLTRPDDQFSRPAPLPPPAR
jgi:ankyrin repeat protein